MEDQDIVRVHVIAPEGFDNPGQPTGGNIYDRRVCAGLAEAGWEVLVATVAAPWSVRGSGARADLARVVSAIPDGETVLIDVRLHRRWHRPGQLIPPVDPAALAAALGDWLGDEGHRHRLRAAVRQRQPTRRGWEQTTREIADALTA
jgi:glycosyltransferase involved in cell wall biosynthesis